MAEADWTAVDRYLESRHGAGDDVLAAALKASAEAGLPDISVSPMQGKLLEVLVAAAGGTRVLEIGTLGGYSAIWMARALSSGGKVISLERDPLHAEVARENLRRAGLEDRVDIWIGDAIELLPKLAAAGAGPFDFVFIDADKARIPDYFDWSVKLGRAGTMILVDNVIRRGRIVDEEAADESVVGVRQFLGQVGQDRRVDATTIQTVGAKGYDGFTLATVKNPGNR